MIQLIQVAGGDVFSVNRETARIERWTRRDWNTPYTQQQESDLEGFVDAKIGEPLRYCTPVGWRRAPNVVRMTWMNDGQDLEEMLYADEWIAGYEAFFHRGEWASNPYMRGTLENNFWTKGYDNAANGVQQEAR